jgi:DNA-binding GntR family transcriptional regulator
MPRSETRAERIYANLRGDILTGRLLPGQRLPFADLGVRYGTSVGVLREALSRLVEQGLVLSEPQLGFRVTPVSQEDLRDLTSTRLDIETLCLRHAINHGDLAWESSVVAAFHTLDRTPELATTEPPTVNEDWAAAHAAFHAAVLEGCPGRRLREIAASLRDASELYRRWSRHLGSEDTRDIAGEHRALRDAVLARDEEQAVAALTKHISYTTRALLSSAPADLMATSDVTPANA